MGGGDLEADGSGGGGGIGQGTDAGAHARDGDRAEGSGGGRHGRIAESAAAGGRRARDGLHDAAPAPASADSSRGRPVAVP